MKKIFQENIFFFIPYFIFLSGAGIFLTIYTKAQVHIAINQWRFVFCDYFFCYATYLGDGAAWVSIVVLLCFIRYRYALFVGLSNLVAFGITQTLKYTVFDNVDRPVKFFEDMHQHLNLVPWVNNYIYNSFPSGHTTAAFATFFSLALIMKNNYLKLLMFFVALTIGFSRVYLSQHFLNDVYAGSLIGVIVSCFVFQFFFLSEKTKNILWMDKSFLKRK